MILALHKDSSPDANDHAWLERAYAYAVRDYDQWTNIPHLAAKTGLSRYFDHGSGPVPEIMGNPNNYYRGICHFLLLHGGPGSDCLVRLNSKDPVWTTTGPIFPFFGHDQGTKDGEADKLDEVHHLALTADFYRGDRSMRESGFDVCFRFGDFSGKTHHFAAVCLNSLLHKTETDFAEISEILGKTEQAAQWKAKAAARAELITKYFWNAERGMYFDYNSVTNEMSNYEFAATFYPLWVGAATEEQAAAVVKNLPVFEQPGGIAMSTRESEAQWDFPYGWAPIQLIVVEGLRRYGYVLEANRIAENFVTMVAQNYEKDHTIREKYNVVTRSSATRIRVGYSQNEIGFGWTNGVYSELLAQLQQS
jgi:alpha,alpha-trehalase